MTRPPIERKPTSRPTPAAQREALLADPGFGKVFSDHMVTAHYEKDKGWYRAELGAREPLSLDPSANVFHYGQAVFEGLKAFRCANGKIGLFRVKDHDRRLFNSAARMAMPALPEGFFLEAIEALIRQDIDWVPTKKGHALYLRPTLIGTEPCLGVRPSKQHLFFLLASPSASYFSKGAATIRVWITREFSRAAPGGTGAAKTAGNYGASLLAQKQAIENNCDQVMWLDSSERRYVEELGGMNVFFVWKNGSSFELVTPSLGDTVLPGVTRASIMDLGREAGYSVAERRISIDEVIEGISNGKLAEAFACGTAAVITPIAKLQGTEGEWIIHRDGPGPVAQKLREKLLAIQCGDEVDTRGWMHIID